MSKTIVVIGVTGIQGASVAETFLSLAEWKVRGITRNPLGSAARALSAKGVEIVQGDLDDKSTLVPAFAGATVIFSNTDMFPHLFDAMASKIDTGGRSANQYGYDREVKHGTNIAEVAASPAVLASLERFIYSGLSDARRWSHGKYQGIYHYQAKAEVERITRTNFPALAARMSIVQIGYYHTNWKLAPAQAPQKQADGRFEIQRTFRPAHVHPFVDPSRDTGAFVKALVDLPAGTGLLGVSEFMTWPEYAKLWGEVNGVRAVYKQVSDEEHFKDTPPDLGDDIGQGFKYIEEFTHSGGDPSIHTAEELNITIPVTSVREYIEREDWSSVLGPKAV